MDKIVFNQLIFEVTRRCNMACGHCLRGDAQNVDLSSVDIDGVLDQTEAIGQLAISGGEPILNVAGMRYIANGIARRGIPLMRVEIITNGLVYDERFIAIVKRFSEIVHLTQQHGYENREREPWRIQVGVSLDRYHESPELCKKNYLRYKNAMKGFAEVLQVRHGNAPRNMGRAVALTDVVDHTLIRESYMLQKIEVLSANHKPMCKFYDSYRLDRPDQKIVCCGVYLNAYGEILPGLACDMDYSYYGDGAIVCYSGDSIWDGILKYNKEHDRQHCTYCDDLRAKADYLLNLQDKRKADKEHALVTATEAQDEPSAEPMYIGDIQRYRKKLIESGIPDEYAEREKRAKAKNYLTILGRTRT